jgi:hypothetical protein
MMTSFHTRTKSGLRAALLLTALALTIPVVPALAQQGAQQTPGATLPPALRAAFVSGNAQQMSAAINTLSGGNPQRAAALASQVVVAAEAALATNPQVAIQAAAAAVESVRATPVLTTSPQQTENVLTRAARIYVSPAVQRTAPELAASVASSSMTVASQTGNSTLIANMAVQSMVVAESVLAINPAAAVQLAGQATQSVGSSSAVQQTAPQQSMSVATSAARIIVNPGAQRVAPEGVATMTVSVTTVVSNPTVYQSSPTAAVQAMANAFAASNSAAITASSPGTAGIVREAVNNASTNTTLNIVNANNAGEMNRILGGQVAVQQTAPQPGSGTTTTQQNSTTTTPATTQQAQNPQVADPVINTSNASPS